MMPSQEAYDIYLDVLTHKIEYKDLDIKDCTFDFHVIELPYGGSLNKPPLDEKEIANKRSICQIKNNDNICLARSIVTALCIQNPELLCEKLGYKKLNKNDIPYIKKGRLLQKTLAVKLHEMCNIPLEVCNLDYVKQFEKFLDIQINIFCRENFNEKIYSGVYKPISIYIYNNRNHFDVITTITGFLGKRNYCDYCQVSYKRNDEHKCLLKCARCFRKESNCEGEEFLCNDCFRSFKGKKCYENHKYKNDKASVCEILWKCSKCKRNLNRIERKPEDHKCSERQCKNCRDFVDKDHKCYMKTKRSKGGLCQYSCFKKQNLDGTLEECGLCKQSAGISCMKTCNIKKPDKRYDLCDQCKYTDFSEKYFFFDLETMQETGNHEVNVVINHDFHGNKTIFNDENEYCRWLFDGKHYGYTVLAHYGKGFDFQFLAKYCFKNKIKVFTIYQGNKLMYMQSSDYNIRFIDSFNFTLIPLRNFPKTFGLRELAKGYFPHLFNTKSNQNYIGKYPDKCYYGYDSMTGEQRKTFEKWYGTVKDETFDFRKEIIKYCDSDVDILRIGCLELKKLFLKTADIDPFRYVTLAGVCMAIYRNNFLKENTIAIDEDVIQ
ncbi:hypothetical protein AVEN_1929-1 [Araneus ventricosus]|uniref:DNA-directed DNA polymerase n=1 Tax=Araneus ventricosus TaxID=182803 RepID=A0A4Y2KRE5_ARAVE|nr:hypothetical protein AVEN_1929-1 [Araneus ventricosus]